MNERRKIAEASYFLDRMQSVQTNLHHFEYELSAFLSSSRSVLQYALDKAKPKPGGQAWYDAFARNQVIAFFKDKRDTSIHQEPVRPALSLHLVDGLSVSSTLVSVSMTDADGTVITGIAQPTQKTTEPETLPGTSVTLTFRFDDWPGPESVIELCQHYLKEVVILVEDGERKGYL
jgi:hypothetical protein